MDMGPAYDKSAREPGHATNANVRYDPLHVVHLVGGVDPSPVALRAASHAVPLSPRTVGWPRRGCPDRRSRQRRDEAVSQILSRM